MKFFYRLERKYSKFAIKNLMNYIVVLYIIGFFIRPVFYYENLSLDMEKIFSGEIYRLFTWLLVPPSRSPIWVVFSILLYHYIGKILDLVWGSFRFNVYIFMGILFHVIGSFLVYFIFKEIMFLDTGAFNLSLFLAYAVTFPESEFRIYFMIPVKAKFLGIFYFGVEALYFIVGDLSTRLGIVFSLLNFLVFIVFTGRLSFALKNINTNIKKDKNKLNFEKIKAKTRIHRCKVCGRTSDTNEDLEFRYCSKCDGNYEYCEDHIFTHVHIKNDK